MYDMISRELKALIQNQLAAAAQPSPTDHPVDEYDEYDNDDIEVYLKYGWTVLIIDISNSLRNWAREP